MSILKQTIQVQLGSTILWQTPGNVEDWNTFRRDVDSVDRPPHVERFAGKFAGTWARQHSYTVHRQANTFFYFVFSALFCITTGSVKLQNIGLLKFLDLLQKLIYFNC